MRSICKCDEIGENPINESCTNKKPTISETQLGIKRLNIKIKTKGHDTAFFQ